MPFLILVLKPIMINNENGCASPRNLSELILGMGIFSALICLLTLQDPYNKIGCVLVGVSSTYLWSKYRAVNRVIDEGGYGIVNIV